MKIYPTISDDKLRQGFTPENDIFQLKPLAEGMTNIVSTIENPLVIAFDGQWGSGKTTFLKMWKAHLEQDEFPVIYFDAFENDYVQDAFAALAREIVTLAESSKPLQDKAGQKIAEKAVELGKLLAKGALRVGARAAVRAASAGLVTQEDISESAKEAQQELDAILDQEIGHLIGDSKKQKDIALSFKNALSELPQQLKPPNENGSHNPLVFIVDELDRCKPIFALEMLERIKHFMAVPNVHFVLGVSNIQLQNSVRAAYGSEIDAISYLQKFVSFSISHNDQQDSSGETRGTQYIRYLQSHLRFPFRDSNEYKNSMMFLEEVVRRRQLTLRVVEKIYAHIALALSFAGERRLKAAPIIAGLCILKVVEPKLFELAKLKQITFDQVHDVFVVGGLGSDFNMRKFEWSVNWWRYCLLADIPDELNEFGRGLIQADLERTDVVPWTAKNIVEKLALT